MYKRFNRKSFIVAIKSSDAASSSISWSSLEEGERGRGDVEDEGERNRGDDKGDRERGRGEYDEEGERGGETDAKGEAMVSDKVLLLRLSKRRGRRICSEEYRETDLALLSLSPLLLLSLRLRLRLRWVLLP